MYLKYLDLFYSKWIELNCWQPSEELSLWSPIINVLVCFWLRTYKFGCQTGGGIPTVYCDCTVFLFLLQVFQTDIKNTIFRKTCIVFYLSRSLWKQFQTYSCHILSFRVVYSSYLNNRFYWLIEQNQTMP